MQDEVNCKDVKIVEFKRIAHRIAKKARKGFSTKALGAVVKSVKKPSETSLTPFKI